MTTMTVTIILALIYGDRTRDQAQTLYTQTASNSHSRVRGGCWPSPFIGEDPEPPCGKQLVGLSRPIAGQPCSPDTRRQQALLSSTRA